MRITIVGCSGSMSGPASAASCYLVQADSTDEAGRTRTHSLVLDLGPGDVVEVGPMLVEAFEAEHTVPAVGLRIMGPSESDPRAEAAFAYTGDTDLCDTEVEMARGVDLLLSECAFEDGRDTVRGVHMVGSRAGELASRAGVGRLLLTHLQPWTDPETVRRAAEGVFDGPVRCVKPGETYRV